MTTSATGMPRGRGFTVADLDALPDDGHRHELLDGALVVTPAPSWRHQRVVTELLVVLHAACPTGLEVLVAPFDVRLSDDTNVQPDLVVARSTDLTEAHLPTAPVLAVEVLSPSTRTIDLHSKRERLRRADCASYWAVDPDEGRLLAWDLDATGAYVQVADVTGQESWTTRLPYPVTLTPGQLLGRR